MLHANNESYSSASQEEIFDGHTAANKAVLRALQLEKEGWLSADPAHIPAELMLDIAYAKQVLADLESTARSGTD